MPPLEPTNVCSVASSKPVNGISTNPINHIQKGEAATVNTTIRRTLLVSALLAVFALGVSFGQNKFGQPKTLIHFVALKWKADSTPAQRQAAIDGIKTMAGKIPGIKNVWLKTEKVQGVSQAVPFDAAFAIEFADAASLKAYATHPAHTEWESIYVPVREESRNHVVTN